MKKISCFMDISQDNMGYRFLPSGDVFSFTHTHSRGEYLINQFRGNVKDGSANNIYLRIYDNGYPAKVYPLLGIQSASKLSFSEEALVYEGMLEDISYQVTFSPEGSIWFWKVSLWGNDKEVDVIYGQDIGIAEAAGVYTNELYMSEYLGHTVFEEDTGYVICSRQNMPANDVFPYLQQGTLGIKATHYSTDGLQFFGLSYKDTNTPEILHSDLLSYNLQYEFAYTALQTERISLQGEHTFAFYGFFLPDHKEAVREAEYRELIKQAYEKNSNRSFKTHPLKPVRVKEHFGSPYSSPSFEKAEIDALFPERTLEEVENDSLFSFFTKEHSHVVTKEKELFTERPHGTIIITPPDVTKVSSRLISSTQYMYGIFNSHIVIGNTDLHKFLSTPRGFLNLLKNSGQRIYIRIDRQYHLLTLPGLFEMGMNYSRWFYKLPEDTLIITAFTAVSSTDLVLSVVSDKNLTYDFIITNQLVMGNNEYTKDLEYTAIEDGLRFTLDSTVYPGLHYDLLLPDIDFTLSDDRIFFENDTPFDESFLTISLRNSHFTLLIKGSLTETSLDKTVHYDFLSEKEKALSFYQGVINHFNLSGITGNEKIDILNETAWWYTHNAMIHFSMPHGLEQPGGAAWGTRDVCQGPMEFFLATQNHTILRQILLNIYSHQNYETKEWPQWFMFDKYSFNAGECHGDVIFWPLKCVADYILASGDTDILKELLPYEDAPDKQQSLLEHIRLALKNLKETRFVKDTGLITYAGGDWDDTLQPASEELKVKLVSSWTVALAYQTFTTLNTALKDTEPELAKEFSFLSGLVKDAFCHILIKDHIIAGFLECGDTYRHMLHPADNTTGIHYRLLPMTRSIIAELADKEQAEKNVSVIKQNLKCPDGVRLMDRPAHYDGGVSRLFKRAEQAANVGREISLQYTHAHIRYIEAMAKLGAGKEAWDSLFVINPILIRKTVANANIRQSNLYFSSSEGAYKDRYEYEQNFKLLKTGDIKVKGGWRLYSSGPGIYFRQLVSHVLGIRFTKDGIIIDPVLPKELDGLHFTYMCFGKTFTFLYRIGEREETRITSQGREVSAKPINNPYRTAGLLIAKEELLTCDENVTVHVKAFS